MSTAALELYEKLVCDMNGRIMRLPAELLSVNPPAELVQWHTVLNQQLVFGCGPQTWTTCLCGSNEHSTLSHLKDYLERLGSRFF